MSRVNLLWFLNESCCVQGFGPVYGISVFLMIFVEKNYGKCLFLVKNSVFTTSFIIYIFTLYLHAAGKVFSRYQSRFPKKGQI